ncbi:MAG: HlyC/CorC family transporter [Pseudomonadota bacterium]
MEVSLLFSLLAVLFLLLLSAFFSGSETAFTAASKARLTSKEKEGDKRAALVNSIRDTKDRMIGALLLGNNLVNILASALATSVLIELFGDAGIFYATLVMTMLVLIFAEVLPKTYAFHNAESMALRIAPIIKVIIMVFAPVTETVTWVVRGFLKLFGVDISRVAKGSHLELLRGVIEMHAGPQKKVSEQRAMLRSILDLADVDVEDIMIHRQNVTMIDATLSPAEIVQAVLESPYTRLPMWEEDQDNIIGVLHVKQLLREVNNANGKLNKLDMAKLLMEPWFIPETTDLYEQLQAFRERKEHFAIVVDEYGAFMGIVTLEDILEEIVGEIDDEHDHSVPGVRRLGSDVFIVNGDVTLRDLNREFELGLPDDEEYSTVAGLVLHEAETLPEPGQSFMFYGFRLDVIGKQDNQLTRIRLTKLEGAQAA